MNHQKHYLIYIILLLVPCLWLVSCHGDEDEPVPPAPNPIGAPGKQLARTLIVYVAGENSLSDVNVQAVRNDSLEIARGLASLGDDARVVVMIDDPKSSRLCVGTRTEPLQQVKVFDDNVCMTRKEGMTSVLNEIVKTYPATHYGLVLWSHGSGWIFQDASPGAAKECRRSFGIDNGVRQVTNDGPQMEIPDLAEVLSQFPHFEYILFDACFMQCIEVAYELRHVTDYVIGSPAEIPGDGAPYDRLMKAMCQVPADVEAIVRDYVDYYESGLGGRVYVGAEISLIKTSGLENLAEVSAPLFMKLLGNRRIPECSGVQRYCYSDFSTKYTEYYDWKHWMYQSLSSEEYADWCRAYDAAVPVTALSPRWFSAYPTEAIRWMTDVEHSGGVSVFIPKQRYEGNGWTDAYHRLSWYQDAGLHQTGW